MVQYKQFNERVDMEQSIESYHPVGDAVLVELAETYKYVVTPDAKYDTKTSGLVVRVDDNSDFGYLEGKVAFWDAYKDACSFEINSKKYAFINGEDIRGYKNV